MRRKFYLLTTVFVILSAAGGLLFYTEQRHTPVWRQALDSQHPMMQIVQMDRAQQPQNFDSDTGYHAASYGNFQYQWSTEAGQYTTEWLTLPPAQDVRCVLATHANREQAFFVSFYDDGLWNQAWIVYAGPSRTIGETFDARFEATLDQLACDLAL